MFTFFVIRVLWISKRPTHVVQTVMCMLRYAKCNSLKLKRISRHYNIIKAWSLWTVYGKWKMISEINTTFFVKRLRWERRQPVGNLWSVVEFRTTEYKIHPEESMIWTCDVSRATHRSSQWFTVSDLGILLISVLTCKSTVDCKPLW